MTDCFVMPIKKGIIRISKSENMKQSYLERYGIIKVPDAGKVCDVAVCGNKITLPNGRELSFELRPCGDSEYWADEMRYMLERFRSKLPLLVDIEGRHNEERIELDETADGWESDRKFGISIDIEKDERFYGLGEARGDSIQLRGDSYQNWAIYQYDEIVIPLVISNKNWGIFIAAQDRHFVDIDDRIKDKLTVAGNWDDLDIFLLYGDSMKELITLYTDITGRSMLLPKWGYGLTYIAPIYQNQFEILNDLMKFREKHIPCDIVSLEPGWMENHFDYSFEKQWSLERFHMENFMRSREYPRSFPSVVRRFGFHMALWLCLNYDLCDNEERKAGGEGKLRPWYDHIKQFVNDGADGFKMDPSDMILRINPKKIYTNGESEMSMHNISQVLVPKQMYEGFTEQMNKRPFLHYCGGYSGQQHWGGATTGDNGGLLGSMIWMQGLAMCGFMNVTVDMNIYEPAAIHFAMLAPWAQHNAWAGCDQPWYAGAENEQIYTYYARLRYRLLPYIYSYAIECNETGVPMIRPMPLEFQDDSECGELSCQYMLGEYIMLSAFTDRVYLPKGEWVDFWTGREYSGPMYLESYEPPKGRGGGFFVKKGAVIPQWSDRDYISQYTDENIQLHFYPNDRSEFVFREDDGESLDYTSSASCHTAIACEETKNSVKIHIGRRIGDYRGKPQKRVWEIYVHNYSRGIEVVCDEADAEYKIIMNNNE